jgi:hypothetical protein
MPKFVKTIVKKSSLIPWGSGEIVAENSQYLTDVEKQLLQSMKAEVLNLPGYIGFETTRIGNTQIDSYEFDNIGNLNDYLDKFVKQDSVQYQPESVISLYHVMVVLKLKQLGLSESYTTSTSIETA